MITFNKNQQVDQDSIYLDIDNSNYVIELPESVIIQQSEGFLNSQIKVLVLNDMEAKCKKSNLIGETIDFHKKIESLSRKLEIDIL